MRTITDGMSAPAAVHIPPIGSPAIVARGLRKRFGSVEAVRDLSFEVRPGQVTGFLGPNGAGKSTTMRMVLGLVRPTAGSASVLGLPYASLDRPATAVGAVLEVQSFHPLRSGRNHLRVLAATSASTRYSTSWTSLPRPTARRVATRSGCGSGSGSLARCWAIRAS